MKRDVFVALALAFMMFEVEMRDVFMFKHKNIKHP